MQYGTVRDIGTNCYVPIKVPTEKVVIVDLLRRRKVANPSLHHVDDDLLEVVAGLRGRWPLPVGAVGALGLVARHTADAVLHLRAEHVVVEVVLVLKELKVNEGEW